MSDYKNFFRVPTLVFGLLLVAAVYYFVTSVAGQEEGIYLPGFLAAFGLFTMAHLPFGFSVIQSIFRKKILDEQNRIAEWTVEQDEWQKFISTMHNKMFKTIKLIAIANGISPIIFAILLFTEIYDPSLGFSLLIITLFYMVYVLYLPKSITNSLAFGNGRIVFSTKGLYIDGLIYPVTAFKKIKNVELLIEEGNYLLITLFTESNQQKVVTTELKLPIPRGKEKEAEEVKNQLGVLIS